MGFKLKTKSMKNNIEELPLKLKAALNIYGDSAAKQLEAYAKENYSWTPRSSRAHQTIQGGVDWINGNVMSIRVGGNVDYFVYLEFCNEKKYAILKPTIIKNSPKIIRGLANLLED